MSPVHRPGTDPARLKKRADFLRAAKGRKAHFGLFTIQSVARADGAEDPRVGFTVTKKVGNAVERNRIKRRLRALVRTVTDLGIEPSRDYVVVARRDVLAAPQPTLASQFRAAMRKLGRARAPADADGARQVAALEGPR